MNLFKQKKRFQPGAFVNVRARIVMLALMFSFVGLGMRAVLIHLFPSSSQSLSRMANKQYQKEIVLSPYRGTIYDHRKEPLAISIRVPSFFVNPRIFSPTDEQLSLLGQLLDMPTKQLKDIKAKKSYFSWVKRKVSHNVAKRVKNLEIKGLFEVLEPARFYPAGNSAANLLGYVGIDDKGLAGIERQYEKTIGGDPIKIALAKDAKDQIIISEHQDASPEESGDNIFLTIDRAIQEITERELAAGVATANAKGGFAIVSDPHTGRVLAMANYPFFDPNNTRQINIESTKNQALTNVFEPGSVMKPLVISLAMDKGLVHETQLFDCEDGAIKIGKYTIHDAHKPKKPLLSTEEIIMHSSNVCTYKIAKLLGPELTQQGLNRFGVGVRNISTGFPGEENGSLSSWQSWAPVRFANIGFGQGVTMTGLEVVQAYSVFANGGNLIKPYLLDRIESSDGTTRFVSNTQTLQRVIDAKTARRMRTILYKTIEESATAARLDFHTAGGKTGTSQKVDPKTKAYSHTKHLSTFVGLAPVSDPHIVVYVQIDEPNQKQSYGSLWAAPIFRSITEKTLAYLNVAPDRPNDMKQFAKKEQGPAQHATRIQ